MRQGGGVAVVAMYRYEVKPGRLADFMKKLKEANDPKFTSEVMPKSVRLFRSTVPGPESAGVILMIEYDDMKAYGARTTFESCNPDWKELFAAEPESPEHLVNVELLTEFTIESEMPQEKQREIGF
jgi:hypothetical protein